MPRLLLLLCLLTCLARAQTPITLSDKPTNTLFSLAAIDAKTGLKLVAQFKVHAYLAKKDYVGPAVPTRDFSFIMTRADSLLVVASASGYEEGEFVMVAPCDTCTTYGYSVPLDRTDTVFRQLTKGKAIQLDKVYFDQSSYRMRSESVDQLDKLVRTLQAEPGLKIEIAGHTDNVGDRRLNRSLSENRARVIANYLTTKGISEIRLQSAGYGDTRPAAPNDVEENKRRNRRVEFVVL